MILSTETPVVCEIKTVRPEALANSKTLSNEKTLRIAAFFIDDANQRRSFTSSWEWKLPRGENEISKRTSLKLTATQALTKTSKTWSNQKMPRHLSPLDIFADLAVPILSAVLVLASIPAAAESHYSLEGRLRSLPQSANLIGTAAYDSLLWGEKSKENPLFGFYQIGAKFGGSPTAATFLQVAPVAPLILGVERSMTHRFLKTSYFDCEEIECLGRIDRTDYTAKMAGAYQNWILFASILYRDIQTGDSASNVGLEHESLIVPAGKHRFIETGLLFAYKLPDNQVAGVFHNWGEIEKLGLSFEATYALYQFQWQNLSWTAGVGPYKSTHENINGTSFILSAAKDWGESLSLF